jgi:cell division protein FtsL
MYKVLVILVLFVALGVLVLQQRQRSLELRYQAAKIHRDIQKTQSQLWRQQLEIAEYTSPKVIQSLDPSHAETSVDENDLDSARE